MKINLAFYFISYSAILLGITAFLCRAIYRRAEPIFCGPGVEWLPRLLAAGLGTVSVGYLAMTARWSAYPQPLAQIIDLEMMKLGFGTMLLGAVFSFDLLVLVVSRPGEKRRFGRESELR